VDLDVSPGDALGIVGQNGSGKSTLLKLMAGVFTASEGTLEIGGTVGSLLEIGAGFHPEFSGVENVYLNAAIYGLSRSYVDEHLDEIIGFAELEDFAHTPVKTYSSGMLTRLGFAVATHLDPDILLVDEVLAVGDEAFQRKCYERIWRFKESGGTIVFVSHDPSAVERVCTRAVLLEHGRVVEEGTAEKVLRAYHRRLAGQTAEAAAQRRGGQAGPCTILEFFVIGGDGAIRDRFVEGEPALFEAQLYSETGVRGGSVTIGLGDGSGHVIASQTLPNFDIQPERPEVVRLHIPSLPVREPRFVVDLVIRSHDGEELASSRGALTLAIISRDDLSEGPVRLGGTWELPSSVEHPLTEAVER
jgi:ABC-2 type transport system ATP-binding protein